MTPYREAPARPHVCGPTSLCRSWPVTPHAREPESPCRSLNTPAMPVDDQNQPKERKHRRWAIICSIALGLSVAALVVLFIAGIAVTYIWVTRP